MRADFAMSSFIVSQWLAMDKSKNFAAFNPQYLIVFSTVAALSAAVVALAAQAYLRRQTSTAPDDLLARCQQAIENIERELESLN